MTLPKRTRAAMVLAATTLVVGASAGGWALAQRSPSPVEVTAVATGAAAGAADLTGSWPTTTTTTLLDNLDPESGIGTSGPIGPPWPDSFLVADALAAEVPIYQAPDEPVPTGRTLPNPTVEGFPLVMLVRDQQPGWLKVQINTRPNGATVWVRQRDVAVRTVPNHILVELGKRQLTVFHGDEAIFTAPVAPGRASTPTPLGQYYVDILAKPHNPNGPYGLYQISVTGFSEVYDSFGGGDGQIAIHGTNRPELVGTPASNGCVRMSNEDISSLIHLARQGTPVLIVA